MSNLKEQFNSKTFLITGGAGFIGSNLALHLQTQYPKSRVVIFDCFQNQHQGQPGFINSYGHYKNLIGFNGDIICGDLNSKPDFDKLENYKFDFIFHKAAISDTRENNQEAIMKTNVNTFYDILRLTKKNKARLIYASSGATYGDAKSPQSIGHESPGNAYGYSKYLMDQIAIRFSNENPGLKIFGLRYFNVYGPGEFFKGKTSSMIVQLAHQILQGKNPRLFTNSDQIFRDFVYIEDVIESNINACFANLSGVYNIGSGVERSFQEICDILQKELNTNLTIEYFKNPYSDYQKHTQANIASSVQNLNFSPKYSLESGIKKYIPEINRLYDSEFHERT